MKRVLLGVALSCSMLFAITLTLGWSAAPVAAQGGGISGTVKFTGTAPANPKIDMSEEPACKAKYSTPPTDPVVVVHNGNLQNVFIYVKSGLPAGQKYETPTKEAELDQEGCL